MSQGIHKAPARTFAAAIAGLAVACGLLFAGASPASAHDELIGTDPASGVTLDASPAQLTLTFSAEIADDPGASEVQVTDAAGTSLAGEPAAQDNVLTVPLVGEASGAVTVLWKVVSSDGHPISGEFGFTVTPATTPTPTPTPTPTETVTPEPTPSPTETTAPDDDSTFGEAWPWVLGGLVVVALGGAVLYLLVTRARREKALAGSGSSDSSNASEGGSEPPVDR